MGSFPSPLHLSRLFVSGINHGIYGFHSYCGAVVTQLLLYQFLGLSFADRTCDRRIQYGGGNESDKVANISAVEQLSDWAGIDWC